MRKTTKTLTVRRALTELKLRQCRLGVSDRALSKRIGISRTTLKAINMGMIDMRLGDFLLACDALKASPTQVIKRARAER